MAAKLYVVGTPIGNLEDLSPRAARILSEVDFIAAEDTRVTLKLLNHLEIKKPMVSYFEHNKAMRGVHIVDRILAGESCAIVTDAGMPAISDPGTDLVALCREHGIPIESVPGPSAIVTAAAISGLDVSRFTFEGFLSMNKVSRRERLESLRNEERTMIFYEAPHKLHATLKDMYEYLGERRIAVIKELTKLHESVDILPLSEAADAYSGKLRGEYVVIIEGRVNPERKKYENADGVRIAREYMAEGYKPSEAAKKAAGDTGLKKGDIYALLTGPAEEGED